ncbi:hypothetical protein CY34DRAFT_804230 [Suillus luteus UH-Slu-Lm8-n1]|uniref:Uncharacterized protein n=1 Tax=Suillus luteus UH-Slu-Lm8-n1 TaxID=930992 RepID=A0A0D0B9R3_9AGAM|nr:hypothetical protein CY34DRAFT_804230 [Suillus luteus UH-Slu-Lm8-n1]
MHHIDEGRLFLRIGEARTRNGNEEIRFDGNIYTQERCIRDCVPAYHEQGRKWLTFKSQRYDKARRTL